MHQTHGDEVTIIGVAGRDSTEAALGFIEATGVGELTHLIDLDLEIWRAFGITDQPAWAFIDDDGTVEVYIGPLGADGITDAVDALIDA